MPGEKSQYGIVLMFGLLMYQPFFGFRVGTESREKGSAQAKKRWIYQWLENVHHERLRKPRYCLYAGDLQRTFFQEELSIRGDAPDSDRVKPNPGVPGAENRCIAQLSKVQYDCAAGIVRQFAWARQEISKITYPLRSIGLKDRPWPDHEGAQSLDGLLWMTILHAVRLRGWVASEQRAFPLRQRTSKDRLSVQTV
ncbi:hypothetical protein SISNIDRAFT_465781 [Sistotremastrum niveocremeum HHB9708]|uniref:Uncharacterized protein n=1 Tax=Sistotremastrum niveocremeum HHB9708 TaxID=1314777 RepID=A0A164UW68_9AGAM|nr:hypothetical protein SISNIDRAFT_465781 [Sistotremastrum niveocremeum HHB9708]